MVEGSFEVYGEGACIETQIFEKNKLAGVWDEISIFGHIWPKTTKLA